MDISKLCLNECGNQVATGQNRAGKFCSRSCSNTYHNRLNPKRQAVLVECSWIDCSIFVKKPALRCSEHKGMRASDKGRKHGLYTDNAWDLTIGEVRVTLNNPTTDAFSKFLRSHARRWAVKNMPHNKCHSCDYSKHTELAHIKPLKHFNDSDLVKDTFENNLVRLCPNHHWEFDHGHHSVYFQK